MRERIEREEEISNIIIIFIMCFYYNVSIIYRAQVNGLLMGLVGKWITNGSSGPNIYNTPLNVH